MKFTCRAAALLALTAVAGAASAQDVIATVQNPWEGWFAGGNIGGLWNHTCQSWEPSAAVRGNPALANAFYNRDCPSNGNFIGGVDGGYNFQIDQWVWGFKIDYDAIESKSKSASYTYTNKGGGDPFPSGTYSAYGKISPNGVVLVGPRVGYAIDEWLPWFRVGGAFAFGSTNSQLAYAPAAGSTATAASVSGSKDFKANGFNVGAGVDYDISGPWSIVAEYNYINLGKGSNSSVSCSSSGTVAPGICSRYGNFSLDNIHNSFTANMFRVGFHYSFK